MQAVSLLWQKRQRGLMPLTANNLADTGHALLVRPDELETRTYQILYMDTEGQSREVAALSVETVRKFELVPNASLLLGVTEDDVYIFRDGRKSRFMADRRVSYSDVALSAQSGFFVAAFSDMLFDSHTVVFADANGRVGWTREIGAPVTAVGITREGRAVAVGREDGAVLCLDSGRNVIWECALEEPIRDLAMAHTGSTCAVGTAEGTVALIREGSPQWRSPVGMPVVAIAVDGAAEWVAVVAGDSSDGRLVCFNSTGEPVWEYELDARPSGVSFSPNGRYLAVSTADARATCFSVDFSAVTQTQAGAQFETAQAALEAGQLTEARAALLQVLEVNPGHVEAAERLAEVRSRLVEARLQEAEEHETMGMFADALATLRSAAEIAPLDERVFAARRASQARAVEALIARAEGERDAGNIDGALATMAEALALDPVHIEARQRVADLRAAQAERLRAEGDAQRALGDLDFAIESWRKAAALNPTPELQDLLRAAEVDQCVAAGMRYYGEQRYVEAAFQLKRALALDPDNEEARRYLGYCQGPARGDSGIADRFSRLE